VPDADRSQLKSPDTAAGELVALIAAHIRGSHRVLESAR